MLSGVNFQHAGATAATYNEASKKPLIEPGVLTTLSKIVLVAGIFFAAVPPAGSSGLILALAILVIGVPLLAILACCPKSDDRSRGQGGNARWWNVIDWSDWRNSGGQRLPAPSPAPIPPSAGGGNAGGTRYQSGQPGKVGYGGGHNPPPAPRGVEYRQVPVQPAPQQLPPAAQGRGQANVGFGGGHSQQQPAPPAGRGNGGGGGKVAFGGGH